MSPTTGASRGTLLIVWWVSIGLAVVTAAAFVVRVERPMNASDARPRGGAVFVEQVRGSATAFAETVAALQMRQALRQRAAAVRRHDESGFLGSVVPSARRSEARAYRRLAVVPFDRYVFSGDLSHPRADALATGRASIPVHLRSRLRGDPVASRDLAQARFRFVDGRWRLVAVTPRHPAVWDLERVEVARGTRSLVLAAPGTADASSLAAVADAAAAAVAAVWPMRWPGRVVVVLPRTSGQLTRLVGEPGSANLAGITSFHSFRPGSVVRVQLNPDVFTGLVPLAQQILLRHEITHAAQYARSDDAAPVWLAEGTAEYVGYLGSGVAADVIAPSALAAAAAGQLPNRLPAAADFAFTGGAAGRQLAYEQAWTACQMVADRYGQEALFALYHAVSEGQGPEGVRVPGAIRDVLHVPYRTFVEQWQDWLRSRA